MGQAILTSIQLKFHGFVLACKEVVAFFNISLQAKGKLGSLYMGSGARMHFGFCTKSYLNWHF